MLLEKGLWQVPHSLGHLFLRSGQLPKRYWPRDIAKIAAPKLLLPWHGLVGHLFHCNDKNPNRYLLYEYQRPFGNFSFPDGTIPIYHPRHSPFPLKSNIVPWLGQW